MRITIATGPMLPVPTLRGGAVPRMWQGLAEQFASAGHAVTIFARAFPGQPEHETIAGVSYQRWGGFDQSLSVRKDLLKDLAYAVRACRRLPPGDILITNDFWLPVFATRRSSTGRVVVNANRFPKGQFWLYKKAARIAAASTAVRDAITAQCPGLTERTRVFPNPIDTTVFRPSPPLAGSSGFKTLLFVGRVHPEKGVHLLMEAFRVVHEKHPDWRIRVVGPIAEAQGGGGDAYLQGLQKLATGLPVEFREPIFDPAKLADCYRGADLFCYPSVAEQGESFGVAPLEAMACGVAPVVSSLVCFLDFITPDQSGWCFDHRTERPATTLANALVTAMGSQALRRAVAARAAQAARAFDYGTVARRYLDEFDQLLNAAPARALAST
jgi:glycosyltransferase involved in cell wall biosynthesis